MRRWRKPILVALAALALMLVYAALIVLNQGFYWLHITQVFMIVSGVVLVGAALVIFACLIAYLPGAHWRGLLTMLACIIVCCGVLTLAFFRVASTAVFTSHYGTWAVNGHVYQMSRSLVGHTLMEPLYLDKVAVYECDGSGLWCSRVANDVLIQSDVVLRAGDGRVEMVDADGVVVWTYPP